MLKRNVSADFDLNLRTPRQRLLITVGLAHCLLLYVCMYFSPRNLNWAAPETHQMRTNSLRLIMLPIKDRRALQQTTKPTPMVARGKSREPKPIPNANKTQAKQSDSPGLAAQNQEQHTRTEKAIDHNIAAITQLLEREIAHEERKAEAAKPPNQIVREYWEKQNHPYQNKWQELSAKIEKAAVARGPQEESYTLEDGSRITKLNGVCYKAPDPGRAYLGQAEVRRVFCPRN